MKFNRKFRDRGQLALVIAGLIFFLAGKFAGAKAEAIFNLLFSLCIFGIILLDVVCRRRRSGQRLWTRKAKINISFAGLYCMVFAVHGALVWANVPLPGLVNAIMSAICGLSLLVLALHDWKAGKKRKN